ncbi:MAG: hypothetical protein IJX18_00465, partial [Clostridia bacterium]|nr:hypothetical protein [Clostridia bacterium]
SVFESISVAAILNVTTDSDSLLKNLAYGASNRYNIVGDDFVMNYIICNVVAGVAYDDMHDPFDTITFIETVGTDDIYYVSNWKESYYIRGNGVGPYYAYETQEEAHEGLEENKLKYRKQMLSNLRGSEAHLFIEEIELGAALGITPTSTDKLLVAIAFGYEGTHFTLNGEEVVWLPNPDTGLSFRPRTLHDLRSAENIIQTIRISDFIGDVNQEENPLMYTIKEKQWTVNDITKENIDGLTLKEVMYIPETDDGSVLYALRNDTIGNLETAIKNLTLRNVLGGSVSENKFLKQLADVPIKDMKNALNDLTVVKVFEDDVYEAGTTDLTGAWKYLLTDADPTDGTTAVDEYTVNDFDEMMDNMATNIKGTAIKTLVADELMEFEGINLDQTTIYGTPISTMLPGKTVLGDLSLIDMLNVLQP